MRPPSSKNFVLRWITRALLLFIFIASAGFAIAAWWWTAPLAQDKGPAQVSITAGSSALRASRAVARAGIHVEPQWLAWAAHVMGYSDDFQVGFFEIPSGSSPHDILKILAYGKPKALMLRFIEGWNFSQMRSALKSAPDLKPDTQGMREEELMNALGMLGMHPEGLFFPDTYAYAPGSSDWEILKKAQATMQTRLNQAWKSRAPNLPYLTPYEALIMASIVEKETGNPKDRGMVAGVFVNRLRKGMRLQTDPTVIYGLGSGFDGNLRKIHLQTDHAYNTYTRSGLPPTPIAAPSMASLQAATQPTDTDAIFFVAKGDGSGYSYFSSTLAEHNAAVRRYQLRLRD